MLCYFRFTLIRVIDFDPFFFFLCGPAAPAGLFEGAWCSVTVCLCLEGCISHLQRRRFSFLFPLAHFALRDIPWWMMSLKSGFICVPPGTVDIVSSHLKVAENELLVTTGHAFWALDSVCPFTTQDFDLQADTLRSSNKSTSQDKVFGLLVDVPQGCCCFFSSILRWSLVLIPEDTGRSKRDEMGEKGADYTELPSKNKHPHLPRLTDHQRMSCGLSLNLKLKLRNA